MTLPSGWIPNTTAPEAQVAPYTGDQTATWAPGKSGNPSNAGLGIQPTSVLNPAGTGGSVPVMFMTLDELLKLKGPQLD